MACGVDALFIYCSIIVLDFGANLMLAVTHGGALMQTQLTIFGLALLCGMAWLRQGTRVRVLSALPCPITSETAPNKTAFTPAPEGAAT
jgi:hypothetical protein